MRFFEGILFMSMVLYIVLMKLYKVRKVGVIAFFTLLLPIVFLLHYVIERTRWQLYPLYILILIYIIIGVLVIMGRFKEYTFITHPKIKTVVIVLSIITLVITLILAIILPVYNISKPTGKYEIGTLTYEVTDPYTKAIYSENTDKNRRIKIQIWYPAENTKGYSRVPWLEDGVPVAKGVSKVMGLPHFLLTHTALVKSNSYKGAPIKEIQEKYPVVIVSHGWTGFRNLHTDVEEMLASNGYVVIGIDHTFGSAAVVFEDREVNYFNQKALPNGDVPNFLDYGNTLIKTYERDIILTLDKVEQFQLGKDESIFKGKLDTSNVGLLGHSTGGGASVLAALRDERVKAVMGLDAWVEPINKDELQSGLNIQGLFLRSGQWEQGPNNSNLGFLLDNSNVKGEAYQLNGTTHLDFSMMYMYSPLIKYFNFSGKLDGREGASIQQDFELNYFNKYLKGNSDIDIKDVSDKYGGISDKIR